jgi:hypothetical protein
VEIKSESFIFRESPSMFQEQNLKKLLVTGILRQYFAVDSFALPRNTDRRL